MTMRAHPDSHEIVPDLEQLGRSAECCYDTDLGRIRRNITRAGTVPRGAQAALFRSGN